MATGSLSLHPFSFRVSPASLASPASPSNRTPGAIVCRPAKLHRTAGFCPMVVSNSYSGSTEYNEVSAKHRTTTPPPDLPSMLLHGGVIFLGMPLVPIVTELIIAQFLYLQLEDPDHPISFHVNSLGTTRADGEPIGLESEGFAVYDAMTGVPNIVETLNFGQCAGFTCLFVAAGRKGKRFSMPNARAMIHEFRVPPVSNMPASKVDIRAKQVKRNWDRFLELFAKHTGNSIDDVSKAVKNGTYYMDASQALQFGVIDRIATPQKELMRDIGSSKEWDKKAGIKVADEF